MRASTGATAAATRGIGHSTSDDPAEVARAAVRAALGGREAHPGDLVLLFPNADYDTDALHRAAVDAAAPAQVVGATTCGAFTSEAVVPHGCVAVHLPADGASFGICHADLGDDIAGSTRAAVEAARDRADGDGPESALLVLCDGLVADQREVARGAYEVTGALVPLVGGAAGDDLTWHATTTFGEGRASTHGIVAVWINADHPLVVSVDHGWRPIGRPMLVTRAEGAVVHELDGRRALDAYLEQRGAELLQGRSTGERAMERPIGLPNAFGRYDLRQIHEFTDDGGLVLPTAVAEQTVVRVMASDGEALLGGAAAAAQAAVDELDGPARLSIVFSCYTRAPLLGERMREEVGVVSRALGGVPAAGFMTYGEFARVPGSTGIHNSSVALLTI